MDLNDYRSDLTRYVQRRLRDQSAVEDVVQETFLLTQQWISHGHTPEKPLALLYTTARNVIQKDRERRRQPMTGEDMDALVSDAPPIEQQVTRERQRELLYAAIDTLPEKQRDAVILNKIYQYSGNETADCMGISVNTVKMHVRRGIAQVTDVIHARMA